MCHPDTVDPCVGKALNLTHKVSCQSWRDQPARRLITAPEVMPADLWKIYARQREEHVAFVCIMEVVRVCHCGKVQVVPYQDSGNGLDCQLFIYAFEGPIDTFHDADPDLD